MRAEDMTAEQLRELADTKTADELREVLMAMAGAEEVPASSHREVDGLGFEVDEKRLKSWRALRMMRGIVAGGGEFSVEALDAMLGFIAYTTDLDEDAIVEHCGGDEAPMEDVVALVARIAAEIYPKN